MGINTAIIPTAKTVIKSEFWIYWGKCASLTTFLKLSRYKDDGGEKKFSADSSGDLKAIITVRYRGNTISSTVITAVIYAKTVTGRIFFIIAPPQNGN
jgi:hypothetical protein